jgi:cyclopropane-fatty-acyl-phospholipid synthase
VGVTLSRTQAQAGRERLTAAGLDDRVEIRLADYRDLDEQYDAVASVGMFEHVGPEHLHEYFTTAYRLTRPGGLFLNHGIVRGDPKSVRASHTRDFAGTYVFPDGGLVPAWRATKHLEVAGFELLDLEQLRRHYALTLRQWVANLERNRDAAVASSSEMDYRIWRLYMAGSAASFEAGKIGVVQLLGQRPDRTTDWLTGARPLRRSAWLERAG